MAHSDDDHQHQPDHPAEDPELVYRTAAIEALLTEKGIVATDGVDALIAAYEDELRPERGARVVARAWLDPDFRQRLLRDGSASIAELGYAISQGTAELVVVENTPTLHNVIVCTLCSCYPTGLLGLPPAWYKDLAYRSRVVAEPRSVLGEFGVELPDDVEVRVWDSTAEVRYLVVPERPAGSEHMTEEQLAALVTRDSMVGTERLRVPS